MIMSRSFKLWGMVAVTVTCTLSYGAERKVIFADDFNRDDAAAVGNGWSAKGAAVLKNNAALFQVNEEEFRPRIKRTFPAQRDGKFTASFRLDWLRTSEGTWAFYIQLGNSAELPRFLIRRSDLAKGVGVNLIWGGGEPVGDKARGSFGYLKDGVFKHLFVVNDMKAPKTVAEDTVVTIDVDVDASTYSVHFNGKTYPDLPLDNKGPIDTIRFITDGCSATGFSKSSIDDVIISKRK